MHTIEGFAYIFSFIDFFHLLFHFLNLFLYKDLLLLIYKIIIRKNLKPLRIH